MKRKKQKRMVIVLCGLLLLFMLSIGYATYSTNLKVNANYNVNDNYDVKITNITTKTLGGHAINNTAPSFNGTTATFDAKLYLPGDYIEYEITVKNSGNIDVSLSSISPSSSNNPAIVYSYSGITSNEKITSNSTKKFIVKVMYDVNVTEQPSSTTSTYELTLNLTQA